MRLCGGVNGGIFSCMVYVYLFINAKDTMNSAKKTLVQSMYP